MVFHFSFEDHVENTLKGQIGIANSQSGFNSTNNSGEKGFGVTGRKGDIRTSSKKDSKKGLRGREMRINFFFLLLLFLFFN